MQDRHGRLPVFQPAPSATKDFYAPQTAMMAIDGQAVNPLEVPYAALSASMHDNGHVSLGDFGLAIRPSTGSFTGFLYADAAGATSTSAGECSRKMIRELFGGPATDEDICYIVFPGTACGNLADPSLIAPRVQSFLADLAQYANTQDVISKLVFPHALDPATIAQPQGLLNWPSFAGLPRNITSFIDDVRQSPVPDLTKTDQYQNTLRAMQGAGFISR